MGIFFKSKTLFSPLFEDVTVYKSVSVLPKASHNVLFSLFNTVYIGMVTHERTEDSIQIYA